MCEKTEDKQCLKDEFSLVFNKVRQQKDQNWIIKFHICTLVEGREWISPAFFSPTVKFNYGIVNELKKHKAIGECVEERGALWECVHFVCMSVCVL